MHVLAIIGGVWLHAIGDLALGLIGTVIASGTSGFVYDEYYEFRSRCAAAFELLPMPMVLSLTGLILIRWGFAGM